MIALISAKLEIVQDKIIVGALSSVMRVRFLIKHNFDDIIAAKQWHRNRNINAQQAL